jgi:hypothetical protein
LTCCGGRTVLVVHAAVRETAATLTVTLVSPRQIIDKMATGTTGDNIRKQNKAGKQTAGKVRKDSHGNMRGGSCPEIAAAAAATVGGDVAASTVAGDARDNVHYGLLSIPASTPTPTSQHGDDSDTNVEPGGCHTTNNNKRVTRNTNSASILPHAAVLSSDTAVNAAATITTPQRQIKTKIKICAAGAVNDTAARADADRRRSRRNTTTMYTTTTPLMSKSKSNTSMTDETAHRINHSLLAIANTHHSESPLELVPPPLLHVPPPSNGSCSTSTGTAAAAPFSHAVTNILKVAVTASAGGGTTSELAHAALCGIGGAAVLRLPPPLMLMTSPTPSANQQQQQQQLQLQLPPPMSGIFYKRRDVFQKQWRPRYFVLNPVTGMLGYYLLPSAATAPTVTSKEKEHARRRHKNGSPRKRKTVRLEASLNASHQRGHAAMMQSTSNSNDRMIVPGTATESHSTAQALLLAPTDTDVNINININSDSMNDSNNNVLASSSSSTGVDAGADDENDNNSNTVNTIAAAVSAPAGPPRGSIFLPGCHVYANHEKTKTLQTRYTQGKYVPADHDTTSEDGSGAASGSARGRKKRKQQARQRQRLLSIDSALTGDDPTGTSTSMPDNEDVDYPPAPEAVTIEERYPYTYVLTIAVIPPASTSSTAVIANTGTGSLPPGSASTSANNTANPSAFTGQHLAAKTMRERDQWVAALKAVSHWMDTGGGVGGCGSRSTAAGTARATAAATTILEEETTTPSAPASATSDLPSRDDDDNDTLGDNEEFETQSDDDEEEDDDGYERDADGDDNDVNGVEPEAEAEAELFDEASGDIAPEEAAQKFAAGFDGGEVSNGDNDADSISIPSYYRGVPEELRKVIDTKIQQLLSTTGHISDADDVTTQQPFSPGFNNGTTSYNTATATTHQPKWKTIQQDSNLVAKMRPSEDDEKLFTVRVDATVLDSQNITMAQLVDCLLNGAQWTAPTKPDLTKSSMIKVFNAHTWIMHECVRPVWPTTARDYILVVHWRVLPDTQQVIICGFSHPFPDLCPPQPKTHVRADILLGGNVLTPSSSPTNDNNGGGGIKFQRVVTMDLKGTIPSRILQLVMKNQASFPTVIQDAILTHTATPPARLTKPLHTNDEVLANIIWHIPRVRKGALAAAGGVSGSPALTPGRSSLLASSSSETKKAATPSAPGMFLARLKSYLPVIMVLGMSLVMVYVLMCLALSSILPLIRNDDYDLLHDTTEGKKRLCVAWLVVVLGMSFLASSSTGTASTPKYTTTTTSKIQYIQVRVQVRSARVVVPILLLLPPLLWFGVVRQMLCPDSLLWRQIMQHETPVFLAMHTHYQSLVALVRNLNLDLDLYFPLSVGHELLLCAFLTWYIVRSLAAGRLRDGGGTTNRNTPTNNDVAIRTGQVTCRFQVDVKGALRFIGHQKEQGQQQQQAKLNNGRKAIREDVAATAAVRVVITHIVVKAVALALAEIPDLMRMDEDEEQINIPWLCLDGVYLPQSSSDSFSFMSVDIDVSTGFAPSGGGGSKYVTLRDADQLTVLQIASHTKRLVDEQKQDNGSDGSRSMDASLSWCWLDRRMDGALSKLGWRDPSSIHMGAALVITSPNAEHSDVELDIAPASDPALIGGRPGIVVVVGGVRISRDAKTGTSRPMIAVSISFKASSAHHPGHCRKLAERVQSLLTFPELCDHHEHAGA